MTRRRPEDVIQRAVFEHLAVRRAPWTFAFHVPNCGWQSPVDAATLKGLGVRAGVPDVFVMRNGAIFGLELKAPYGRLTVAQRQAHEDLQLAGATVAVA